MKILTIAFLVPLICIPVSGLAQQSATPSNDIKIELTKENEFVVKIIDVINRSGEKIPGLIELDSFSIEDKLFIFKNSKGTLQKISAEVVKEIDFIRLRQGVLTGKSPSLRVITWNGEIKNLELAYPEVVIQNGYLFLNQNKISKHFDGSNPIRSNSHEWSDKFHNFWMKTKKESPEVFSANFTFEDGRSIISRKMAAAYCKVCLKIETLNLKIDPVKETILIRCKDVFYDMYYE